MPNTMMFAVALMLGQAQGMQPAAPSAGARIPAMMAEAQEAQLSMNQGMRRTVDILREARQGSDIVRMSCVNEKLTVIKGIIRIAEDAFRGLTQAGSRNDEDQASYEHNKIMISRDRVNSLTVQAVNCVGSSATATGETQTKVDEARAIQNRNVLATRPLFGDSRNWQDNEVAQTEPDSSSAEGGGDGASDDTDGSGAAGVSSTGGGLSAGGNVGAPPSNAGGGGDVSGGGGGGSTEPPRPPASASN